MKTEYKVAIVGGIFAIIAAVIGIVPHFFSNQNRPSKNNLSIESNKTDTQSPSSRQLPESPQSNQENEAVSIRSPNEIRQAINGIIETVPERSEKHLWNSGDPNPDIVVDCNCTLTPVGYSVTHASGSTYSVTLRFNVVAHCNRSKHPQGVPECNCEGPVSATAILHVTESGLLNVQEASANVSRCICLQGRGSVYVEKTVRFLNNQSIGL